MLEVLDKVTTSASTKDRAGRVFRLLAETEAGIHGADPQTVHFHEVSGVDTLVDVIGVCLALERLGVASVSCSPLPVGTGTVECAHGTLPLPAPATLAILTRFQIPFAQTEVPAELVTPTGAALLAVLAGGFGPCPPLAANAVGYGAGARELAGRPNVVRAVLGETASETADRDTVVELRTAIDDMTGEQIGYLLQQCLAAGALDAYATPATMKKSRPGVELTVLAPPAKAEAVKGCLFAQSTTFGVREAQVGREMLAREHVTVDVLGEQVRVKVGKRGGVPVTAQAEFEDCRKAAEARRVPLSRVFALAAAAAHQRMRV